MAKQATTPFPTAAEALLRIEGLRDLSLQQRRSLASTVRLLCRIAGNKAPATLRLDPSVCLPMMDGASPIALGISTKSHQNYRAGLRRILRRLGILAPAHRREPVSDPVWMALVAALPARFHPHRLRAFIGFCAADSIAPGDVTNGTLEAYFRERQASRGGSNNRADVREVARQWNKMRQIVPGWPETELTLEAAPSRVRTRPLSTYPACLQAEIEDYLQWLAKSPEDADDDVAYGAASADTVATRKKGIRLLLWGLVETGCDPASITQISDLLQFDRAKQTLRWHRQRLGKAHPSRPNDVLPTHGVGMLAATLKSLAVYCGLPGEADARLRRMLAVYRPKRQNEITEDLSRLLDQLADPEVEARLLHLPRLSMLEARRLRDGWTSEDGVNHPPKPKEACWMAAIAAAIEIELHLPLRVHDLTHLRLGEQVMVHHGSGRSAAQVHLRVIANKNGHVVETWLRDASANLVLEYLQDFRPLGPHPTTKWVFPNRDSGDRPRAKHAFSETIADAIREHTGVHVSVHDFRAFAAALILADHPHAIEDIRALLGHSTYEMASRHYRRTNRQAAAQRLDNAINKRRQRSRAAMRLTLPFIPAVRRRRAG